MTDNPRNPTFRRAVSALLPLCIATACAPEAGDEGPNSSVRDSAGIQIVENRLPPETLSRAFTLGPEPDLVIGRTDDEEAEQLFDVRGAVRLPDGGIAILNAGTREVRLFDPGGRHVRTFGGAGDGPGEFGYAFQLSLIPPDTLMVWDSQTWETTWFDLDGRVLREDQGRTRYGTRIPDGEFSEGGFALPGGLLLRAYRQGDEAPRGEVYRPVSRYLLLSRADSGAVGLAGDVGGIEQIRLDERRYAVVPFGKHSVTAVGGTDPMIWVGDNEAFELRGYDPGGRLVRLIRTDLAPTVVTDALYAEYRDGMRSLGEDFGRTPEQIREMLSDMDEAPLPSTTPHYSSAHVALDGSLWVEAHRESYEESPRTYHRFDPDGRWTGIVELAADMEPLEVGDDYLLVKITDELDVEYVAVYPLLASGGQR